MESLIHADIFFFVSTISIIVATVILAWAGIYLIQAFKNFRDISEVVKRGVENVEEDIENTYHDIEESPIFRFIFGVRHNHHDAKSINRHKHNKE